MSTALAKPPAEVPAEAKEVVSQAKALSKAFRAVSRAVAPAVVSIETTAAMPAGRRGAMPNNLPPQMQQFLNQHGLQLQPFGAPNGMGQQVRGQGTGFVVSDDGYIVTNNHVVRGGQQFTVRFSDGRESPAELVGTDSETDLAVLRVELEDLDHLAFGDSDAAEVGDWVIALGSPFGLTDSVTAGIISAKGRQVGLSPLESYLQTDATINPGNSGGPLVDMDGKVVGINTAIESRSGGSDGIGFAIPASMARPVVDAIIAGSVPSRGYLGVQMQPLDRDLAASFGHSGQGVLVSFVAPDSPAEEAGIEPGDIIVAVNGEQTPSIPRAQRAIKLAAPGTACDIALVREGKPHTVTATLEEFAAAMAAAGGTNGLAQPAPRRLQAPTAQPKAPVRARVESGIEVASIDSALAKERGIADIRGVVVTGLAPAGPGVRAGLRAGDIVRKVGDEAVTEPERFTELVQQTLEAGRSVRLLVERNGEARFVLLRNA